MASTVIHGISNLNIYKLENPNERIRETLDICKDHNTHNGRFISNCKALRETTINAVFMFFINVYASLLLANMLSEKGQWRNLNKRFFNNTLD